MDSLKTVFIIAILAAIAYGVYVSINNDRQAALSPEATDDWPSGPPVVEMGTETDAPAFGFGSPGEGTMPGAPPAMSISSPGELAADKGGEYPGGSSDAEAPPASTWVPETGVPTDDAYAAEPGQKRPPAEMSPGIGRPHPDQVRPPFAEFLSAARERLDRGDLVEVYETLSSWQEDDRLTADEKMQLRSLLDQVAGTVVYSRAHLLEPAYRVRPGDTLDGIAQEHKVTAQLLAKINGIRDPAALAPGDEIKVVRGPFGATIDLEELELTLDLAGRYAGRFPIGVGSDQPQLEGTHTVREKMIGPTYYGREGTVGPEDPANPLGRHWLGLGNQIGIHGTNDPRSVGKAAGRGTIRMGTGDIDDVFDILTVGSRVVIRR